LPKASSSSGVESFVLQKEKQKSSFISQEENSEPEPEPTTTFSFSSAFKYVNVTKPVLEHLYKREKKHKAEYVCTVCT